MISDYDLALQYVLYGQWDNLFTLMFRTNDDLLGKKIHSFLHAYYYASGNHEILNKHDELLYYIDHAIGNWLLYDPEKV